MSPEPFHYDYSRSPVYGRHGMVASSQPLASAAGLQVLRRGGTAADAAVAVAAALNVTEPTSTGLGGDAFALFYDSKTLKVTALNGSGRCPAGLTLERIQA
ncbi:MAG TPA: gamma-glutamyltransferase, partial [Anaerolineaceae bacterium]|nr:gamma-glutamyltransferase [Anaerolineaceae bacterium]